MGSVTGKQETSGAAQGQLVMVCGAARTGTTMLDLMLGNAPDAFSTGEIWAWFRPHRTHHFAPACSCGDPDCSAWQGLLDLPESDLHVALLSRPETRLVVDSSKDLRWVLDSNEWAVARGIACSNVLLWKDPVDLAYSHWKRGRDIRAYRRSFFNYYARFLDLGLPFVAINYHELAQHTPEVLATICTHLDIGYSRGREYFWEKRHHHMFGSAGTARQVEQGGSVIRNDRDFPADFVAAFREEQSWVDSNRKLQAILEQLRAHDIARYQAPRAATGYSPGHRKPLWYYRHALKSVWRRHFPETLSASESK